jgi:membrane-bound metal-dependent hydrolase YbcI (DUF457 family)
MMGHSHAISGALTWSAAAAMLPAKLIGVHLGTSDILLGTFITAGAALLPDLDHQDGSISHFLGPFSHYLCKFIAWISGGHRHGTHSLLFVALVSYGTWAGVNHLGRPFVLGMTFVLLSLAIRALHLCPNGKGVHVWGTVTVLAAGGTMAVDRWITSTPAWLPIAVGLGALTHLVGDCLTKEGCPLFWPIRTRFEIPIIRRTGDKFETSVLAPAMAVGSLVALWYATANVVAVK